MIFVDIPSEACVCLQSMAYQETSASGHSGKRIDFDVSALTDAMTRVLPSDPVSICQYDTSAASPRNASVPLIQMLQQAQASNACTKVYLLPSLQSSLADTKELAADAIIQQSRTCFKIACWNLPDKVWFDTI
jgi:hypothetical protein